MAGSAANPVTVRLRLLARGVVASTVALRAELLVSLAMLAGWALVTLAIGRLVRPDVVWPLSAGLAVLALCGWKFLLQIARDGLYILTRGPNG